MNIVVIGAGGVGGYFGGKLAQAGCNVTFIARGKHLEAIKLNGLKVKSIHGDFIVHPKATDNISEISNPDLVILAVKAWQIKDIAKKLKPRISDKTMILPLQNGADNADQLRSILNKNNVLAGFCKIVSRIEAPGVIDHFAHDPEIVYAEYDNVKTDRVYTVKTLLDKANIKCQISEDIHLDIWKKFLFITTVSGIGALTRSVFGIMREDDGIRQIMYQTANEIVAVANAKEIYLSNNDIELVFKVIDNLNYNTTASMQRDIMNKRPSELDNFNGYIVRTGKQLHISTPINTFIYNCLLPQEKSARS
ncbi:MAG: 2-dehydropantoate 2-reductase [Bacteroidia bacterium]|nr:2-dehydropantoate 2-reductase [Bacteroidia bacterium]NNL32828.1 2-dehydropantoate 2-reductase [Flavobacteriaceae bacterium]